MMRDTELLLLLITAWALIFFRECAQLGMSESKHKLQTL